VAVVGQKAQGYGIGRPDEQETQASVRQGQIEHLRVESFERKRFSLADGERSAGKAGDVELEVASDDRACRTLILVAGHDPVEGDGREGDGGRDEAAYARAVYGKRRLACLPDARAHARRAIVFRRRADGAAPDEAGVDP